MKSTTSCLAIIAATSLAATSAGAAELVIRDAVARVQVISEQRGDLTVTIQQGRVAQRLDMERSGSRIVIRGDQHITGCWGEMNNIRVHTGIFGGHVISMADAPTIVVHAPRDLKIDAGGAIFGTATDAHALSLHQGGCGRWTIGNVENLEASISGGAVLKGGTSDKAQVGASGGGSIELGAVRALEASASGGGHASIAEVNGPLSADASGGGSIMVHGGHPGAMQASASGGGRVIVDAVVGALSAEASGGGHIRVAGATGPVDRSQSGGGSIQVGH